MEVEMSGVKVGVALPTREVAILGAADASPLLKIARQIEELGFDAVYAGDAYVARHRLEPMTLLAAVATMTERVTIGTGALIVPPRNPVALAHVIVTLDQLSGGRLRMGLGAGFPLPVKAELDAEVMTFGERLERMDEMVAGWQIAWNEEDGDLVGKYYDLRPLRDQPLPLQKGGPALWLSGNGKPRAARRIARHYDGWMPIRVTPEEYAANRLAIDTLLHEAGRDPQSLTRCLYTTVNINDDRDQARAGLEDYTHRYNNLPVDTMSGFQLYFGGSTSAFVDWLRRYVDAGARQIVLRIGAFDDYERHLRALADDVVPALHELAVD
jgi:alkanesulfonate monooxygenase SsuD/methylene tetrahydromethanopterin reductase-like flavin-dependent oxidoreductase (luciferase family)